MIGVMHWERVKPQKGTIDELFEGKIRFTNSGSGYVSASHGIPDAATGFWIPSSDLHLETTPRGALYGPKQDYRHLKYVGFAEPTKSIVAGEFVRVSLAKWWKPSQAETPWLRRSETRPVRRSRSRPPEGRSFYAFVTQRH